MARDGTRAAQDKLAQLMESLTVARTSWAEEVREEGRGLGQPVVVYRVFCGAEGGAFGCSRGGAAGAERCKPGSRRAPSDTRGTALAGRGSDQATP